jgi:hypothetical protein
MQPPELATSVLAAYDAIVSVLTTTPNATMVTVTQSSIVYGIATVATNVNPSATFSQASSTPSPYLSDDNSNGECKLLGSFAVFVQGALGALALLTLVFKRWRERPQRPLKVWAFDASKQVVGSILLHLANVLMAMFSAGQIQGAIAKTAASAAGVSTEDKYQPNPCSWYLLNLAIDTTVGIPILIVILKVLTVGASYTPLARPLESIKSGHYSTPPRATWWLKQCLIYFLGLLGMKTCVFFIFQLCPWLGRVGDWALRWTEGNEAVQIAFVMFIFPLIMNGMQYYIIDTFIKNNNKDDDEHDETEHDGDESEQGGLLADDTVVEHSSDDEEVLKGDTNKRRPKAKGRNITPYNPEMQGDGGSSKQRSDATKDLAEHAEQDGANHGPTE